MRQDIFEELTKEIGEQLGKEFDDIEDAMCALKEKKKSKKCSYYGTKQNPFFVANGVDIDFYVDEGGEEYSLEEIEEELEEDEDFMYDNGLFGVASCEKIEIEPNCKIIDWASFQSMFKLDKVVIPDSVEVIGDEAFYDCMNLKEVVLGSGIKLIGNEAFDCYHDYPFIIELTIIYDGTLEDWDKVEKNFDGYTSLITVICSDGETIEYGGNS